jgi:hypothetical protein
VRVAAELGWREAAGARDKSTLRDALRRRPGGEDDWQRLQALVYGERIGEAPPFAGARACIAQLAAAGAAVFVVSHKTRTAAAAPGGPDLHAAARAWLEQHGFIGAAMIRPESVFFEPTRAAKVERLRTLAVATAIDDLPEVLGDAAFPAHVQGWLFAPLGAADGPWPTFPSWFAIARALGFP